MASKKKGNSIKGFISGHLHREKEMVLALLSDPKEHRKVEELKDFFEFWWNVKLCEISIRHVCISIFG